MSCSFLRNINIFLFITVVLCLYAKLASFIHKRGFSFDHGTFHEKYEERPTGFLNQNRQNKQTPVLFSAIGHKLKINGGDSVRTTTTKNKIELMAHNDTIVTLLIDCNCHSKLFAPMR